MMVRGGSTIVDRVLFELLAEANNLSAETLDELTTAVQQADESTVVEVIVTTSSNEDFFPDPAYLYVVVRNDDDWVVLAPI